MKIPHYDIATTDKVTTSHLGDVPPVNTMFGEAFMYFTK
jgi:hypothetical protein